MHMVRSAYKLHMQIEHRQQHGSVGLSTMQVGNLDNTDDDAWKRLWKLPCPKNIQVFAWRLKHESLALRTNIEHKGIRVADTKCLLCGRVDEDGAHLFIKCKLVKQGWRDLAMEKERMDLKDITSVQAMFDYL
ncbi:Threonine dehydratase [Hordeum vulgare]|nr:Threonine dehydratase [Hordeum vulgare]